MTGDIAVADHMDGSNLGRTLQECVANGWVEVENVGPGFRKAMITVKGRRAVRTA